MKTPNKSSRSQKKREKRAKPPHHQRVKWKQEFHETQKALKNQSQIKLSNNHHKRNQGTYQLGRGSYPLGFRNFSPLMIELTKTRHKRWFEIPKPKISFKWSKAIGGQKQSHLSWEDYPFKCPKAKEMLKRGQSEMNITWSPKTWATAQRNQARDRSNNSTMSKTRSHRAKDLVPKDMGNGSTQPSQKWASPQEEAEKGLNTASSRLDTKWGWNNA